LSAIEAGDYTEAVRTFGDNLKRLRAAARPRITQAALAGKLGHVNNSTISKWETEGGLPEPDTITKVADALGVAAADLLEDVELPYERLRRAEKHSVLLTLPVTEDGVQQKHPTGGQFNATSPANRLSESEIHRGLDVFKALHSAADAIRAALDALGGHLDSAVSGQSIEHSAGDPVLPGPAKRRRTR
jgi:transcriptional regulator with XRE-family HTH domain